MAGKVSPPKEEVKPVEVVETFTVTLDTGEKGDADTYEEALEVGAALLSGYPKATFFGVAKKYKRAS